jgi:fatty acid desaturase
MRGHVANIGERGARRRWLGGFVWLGLAIVALAVMLALGAPRPYRLVLLLPFGAAATGFLQSHEKT